MKLSKNYIVFYLKKLKLYLNIVFQIIMSVNIKNISKFYQKKKVLDDISFDLKEGEIVGFRTKWGRKIYPYENNLFIHKARFWKSFSLWKIP